MLGRCFGLLTGCLALLKQENLETPLAAERLASVIHPSQTLLGDMPASSAALWVSYSHCPLYQAVLQTVLQAMFAHADTMHSQTGALSWLVLQLLTL